MDNLDTCFSPPLQDTAEAYQKEDFLPLSEEWTHAEEEEAFSGPINFITDPVLEAYEVNIFGMITEVARLARNLEADRFMFPVKGHPVDISFCFEPGSWLREQEWDGYKLNENIIEEWESINELASLLSV